MVKVSELRGQMPEEDGAGFTSLQALRELIVPEVPSISSYLRDVRLVLAPSSNAFEKTQELLLANRSWGGFRDVSHQTSEFWPTTAPTGVRASVERMMAVQVGFHVRLRTFKTVGFPKPPPEVIEFIRAQDALKQGDENAFWRFVEKQLGRKPDDWLRRILDRHYLPHGENIPSYLMLELLRHHRERLEARNQEEWYTHKFPTKVEGQLSKNMGNDLMRSLESYGASKDARLEGLRENLRSVLVELEAEGYFPAEGRLRNEWLGEVEKHIVAENRLLRQTRKRDKDKEGNVLYKFVPLTLFPTEAGVFVDEFDPYAGVEDGLQLDSLIARAGLSKSESAVLGLFMRGLTPEHIASERGVTRGAVDAHLFNIRTKLRSVS
jgi:DNA-binding CsgD family transcriptional regulator